MSGIVSLLDEPSERFIRALWAELDERYGLHEAVRRVPHPHCSYHVAEDYDLAQLALALRRVAAQARPFAVQLSGLGAFEAPEPVLYLAVERNAALDALHTAIWRALEQEGIARGVSPLYAPEPWRPHITLAQRDLTLEALRAILGEWAGRDLRRDAWISDLTLLYQAAGATTYEPLMRFSLGSVEHK
ncbi:MAG TPA: 2'-5' RNA ligase family protein [Ktedonobacterales bacterium]